MLNVINALEKISIDAQLMCDVASNKCEVLLSQGLDEQTIRMLTTKSSENLAKTAGHTINALIVMLPWRTRLHQEQYSVQCG